MEFHNTKAIYLQIADFVFEQILLKKWKEDDKIPSVREMAIELQVNPNTVSRTYLWLEEKNIVQTQRGVGYFVEKDAIQSVLAIKKEEFLKIDLPGIFKTMDLLEMDITDFEKRYHKRKLL